MTGVDPMTDIQKNSLNFRDVLEPVIPDQDVDQ